MRKGATYIPHGKCLPTSVKSSRTITKKFKEYVKPRRNVIYNRYKFHSRVKSESETFDQFSTDLKMMVKDCKYADSDNKVRYRIVVGIRGHKIREKLI